MYDPELSVRQHLRACTAEVHARLDALALFEPILAGRADWRGYARLLGAYHVFYTSACHTLHAGYRELFPLGVEPPERDPLAVLAGDLCSLRAAPTGRPQTASPASPAEAVGWVWVVEGSSLGARVIDRALDGLFGPRREGRRFFEPLSTSALRWRTVCASMEDYGKRKDALRGMTQGAQDAFACIERCLSHA